MFAEIAGDPANDMALFHAGNPILSPVDGMWVIRPIIQNPCIVSVQNCPSGEVE
jgi:hypothetical protein